MTREASMSLDPYPDGNEYLTSVTQLASLIEQNAVRLIDTREPEDYAAGHLPGAVNLYDIFTYLSTETHGGYPALRRHFAGLFGAVGLTGQERVVVYEDALDNGYGRSCRGWFLLRYLGHPNVTILHGGFQAWLEYNLPVTQTQPTYPATQFPVQVNETLILTADEMQAALGQPGIIKLDCRDHAEWVGISSSPYGPDYTPRKGRIPGAVWIEWYRMMRQAGPIPWFKSPAEIRAEAASVGLTPDSPVYTYCFKGARTSNMCIALHLGGIHNVRCYFSAWNEWSRDPARPIHTGYPKPSRPVA